MIVTTNIRLPEEQWKALKIMAVHAGTSVSALLRQAIAQILSAPATGVAPAGSSRSSGTAGRRERQDPFFDAIGLGAGGPADDSARHDIYLYPKK